METLPISITLITLLLLILLIYCLCVNNENFSLKSKSKSKSESNNKIRDYLKKYTGKSIILMPFDGNSGDALILYGTISLLNDLNIDYKFGDINKDYNNEIILINGGGNLVGVYKDVKNIIKKYQDSNKVILLPHTIKDEDSLLKNLNKNTDIFCRELISYNYVKNIAKYPENIRLDHDMAFQIKKLNKIQELINNNNNNDNNNKTANCYRIDVEKTDIVIPEDNNDISSTIGEYNQVKNTESNERVVKKFLNYLSNYDTINTNRLHVAIGSSLLDKHVNFYANNYYKNKAIYDYSIKNKYPKTKFK